jgi:uncharacterized membrane protein YdfJ with MMPL/SSD domain
MHPTSVALAMVGGIALVYPLIQGREHHWPTWSFAMVPGGLVLLAAFAALQTRRTRRGQTPLVEPSILRRRPYVAGLGVVVGFIGAMGGVMIALNVMFQTGLGSRLPLVIAMVLALSFLLLLMAFQSPLIALKAAIMNLLSIGASFGVVTFVFSHSWTAGLLGIDGVAPVVSFVPLMMFAILFGLSMDYEVFLMTQVDEHWRTTGDARAAVIDGLADTGRVITSAALIMVGVSAPSCSTAIPRSSSSASAWRWRWRSTRR